jgi:uncharacterized tellurite resistance protein B-like protein
MLDIVKQFFARISEGGTADQKKAHAILVAICALLVEMARTDGTFSQTEMEAILSILQEKYGLSQEDADALVAEAQRKLDDSVDLWQFAKLIDENYSIPERIEIAETLWRIVYVDGRMDKYEHHLMNKFGKLLRLTHEQLIGAKLKVLHPTE